jgi:uncharacterized membrane protein
MAAIRRNMFFIKKTASYYVVHITVAALVAYAVTGDLVAAITLSLLEPTIQAAVFFFHEKVWQRRAAGNGADDGARVVAHPQAA